MADRTGRPVSRRGQLARAGFADASSAERALDRSELAGLPLEDGMLATIGHAAADPDRALLALGRLLDVTPDRDDLVAALSADEPLRGRLTSVLGLSTALGDHLVRHPEHWHDLTSVDPAVRPAAGAVRAELLRAVGADPAAAAPVADGPRLDDLRVAYRRQLIQLAAADLADGLDVVQVAAELADLAAAALDAGLAIARAGLAPDAAPCRLAVIGMGKCGGRELNYVSDVDVIFVAEPMPGHDERATLQVATELGSTLMRICADYTAEGTLWPVDAALRPEGRSGPLVRTLASHLSYYRTWAKTWEFQALLKARHVAGDPHIGAAYIDAMQPLVWSAADREGFVDDVRAMRRRVEQHVRPVEADWQLKLGPGGLRDVEFAVQLLQLVHGRTDESLRSGTTLTALAELTNGGYVGRADGAVLDDAYRFLRSLEHRIQLERLRRTHVVPQSEEQLRRLGRSLGMRDNPVRQLVDTWRLHAREVRRLHEKLFYRPLLTAVARLPKDEARLTPEAARARLEALGYLDPAGALRHLEALTSGVSRRAAIQRTLLPVMLGWFADAAEPDAGLAGFRRVSDALGDTHWYLRLLRDEGAAAQRMARVLASSRFATELLLRAPDAVAMFGDDSELRPREREPLEAEVLAAVARHDDPVAGGGSVRAVRRRELLRVATADLVGLLPPERVGESLGIVAGATIAGALEAATRAIEAERRMPLVARIGLVAMGSLGAREMGYASDADVLFVYEPLDDADEEAASNALAVANEMRRLMALPSPEPPLLLDADLRPEGRQGPLVRTVPAYAAHYRRWSDVWERQALLRAAPLAGPPLLLERFFDVVDPIRWPSEGLTEAQLREIRRMKARVESERLPRGADRSTHLKLGPGGLADVEWTVQLLQMRHAATVAGLRTSRTSAALAAAADAGVLAGQDQSILLAAWRMATSIRNTVVLVTGRPSDALPKDARTLAAVSRVLGHGPGESATFVEEYRRVARHCRAVVERVFYGDG